MGSFSDLCQSYLLRKRMCSLAPGAINSTRPSDAYIYVSKHHCSDNGLSPGRRQAIIWTNAGVLLTRPRGINFSEILIEIPNFSVKKYSKLSSAKWRPFCLGLNVLINKARRFLAWSHRQLLHYNDITWVSWRLKSPATRLFIQRFVRATRKHQTTPYWESNGDRWIPLTKGH